MTSKVDALVEKTAEAIARAAFAPMVLERHREDARAALEYVRPIIERGALERAVAALVGDYAYAAADIVRALIPRDEEEKP